MTVQYFTASDGARIAFRDSGGAGRALLCLSGLTRNGTDFDYLAPHLPPGWRVIRMDYRGRGASEWTGPDSYTVPREGRDAVELLDHLGLMRAAVLGASRGGLIAMMLAAVAHGRLLGICLNDVGPVIETDALARIQDYLGRNPAARTHEDAARALAATLPGFEGVPPARWLEEAQRHYVLTGSGLRIDYDPRLREAFAAAFTGPPADLWPLFDACAGLPLALIRGANSDLLTRATADEMARRRPDMIRADVPGRGHIPFLDEPESLAAIHAWLARCAAG
ncbi:alpha/beta fold hydrolase [Ruixingdingia sedimenti]|uniref:Alpha/beta hydrolase n=1 Tax=Ruixingdingia sedimenti TaxID=3073604 RepID=A0ABU1F7B6_9RHOB|nr:alpha/beta hydrolase [Xinfangfangia sp. LG-4]MDR5652765.1 alpha/beta hydrolase [Xinfangfangia sp. LG-4]